MPAGRFDPERGYNFVDLISRKGIRLIQRVIFSVMFGNLFDEDRRRHWRFLRLRDFPPHGGTKNAHGEPVG